MCAVTWPFARANRIFSPAWTTGTDGSGGVKQPQACAGVELTSVRSEKPETKVRACLSTMEPPRGSPTATYVPHDVDGMSRTCPTVGSKIRDGSQFFVAGWMVVGEGEAGVAIDGG